MSATSPPAPAPAADAFFDHVDGGAFAEATLRRNRTDFEALTLEQRVLGRCRGPRPGAQLPRPFLDAPADAGPHRPVRPPQLACSGAVDPFRLISYELFPTLMSDDPGSDRGLRRNICLKATRRH
jgi:hypothetical protein